MPRFGGGGGRSSCKAKPVKRQPPTFYCFPRSNRPAKESDDQPAQPQVPNIYAQKSMEFMGTMASAAAGSVVGLGLNNMIFGPPAEPAQAQAVAQQYGDGACGPQFKGYVKCMEDNAQNTQQCTWAWDLAMQCQEKSGGQKQV